MTIISISGDTVSVSSKGRKVHSKSSTIIRKGVTRPRIIIDDIGRASIGDYFTTVLNDGKPARFDCVDRKDGFVRFDSHDCIISSKWNESDTSEGGYLKSLVRKSMDYVWDLIPEELQEVIVEAPRLCIDGEDVCEFQTKLFLPDESELFDEDECRNLRLYEQLGWYKDRRNRMKGEAFGKDAVDYWTATPHGPALWKIVERVHSGGSADGDYASRAHGVPVCFLVRAEKTR